MSCRALLKTVACFFVLPWAALHCRVLNDTAVCLTTLQCAYLHCSVLFALLCVCLLLGKLLNSLCVFLESCSSLYCNVFFCPTECKFVRQCACLPCRVVLFPVVLHCPTVMHNPSPLKVVAMRIFFP